MSTTWEEQTDKQAKTLMGKGAAMMFREDAQTTVKY